MSQEYPAGHCGERAIKGIDSPFLIFIGYAMNGHQIDIRTAFARTMQEDNERVFCGICPVVVGQIEQVVGCELLLVMGLLCRCYDAD